MAGFVWGRGGRRMTPDDIALQRKIAAGLMQPDYSPIASPWQGLARVAGNLTGALRERAADKAAAANAADSNATIASLLAPQSPPPTADTAGAASSLVPGMDTGDSGPLPAAMTPPPPGSLNPAIAAALASPYVDDGVRKIAMMQWERANPKPVNNDTVADYNFRAATLGKDAADEWLRRGNDPFVSLNLPNGRFYAGPQSGIGAAVGVGASPQAGPTPPATLPPDFDFGQGGPTPPASGSFR